MIVPKAPRRRAQLAEDTPNDRTGTQREIIRRPPAGGQYYPPFRVDGLKNVLRLLRPLFQFAPKLIAAVLALLFLPFLPLMLLVALVLWGSSRK